MSTTFSRRDFLKHSTTLAVGTGLAGFVSASPSAAASPAGQEGEWRNKVSGMRYRRLGRTGFMVSEMVCGGDPIVAENRRHVELALEMGLNYLDTAPLYGEGKSEQGYGEFLKAVGRERVFLTTKVSPMGLVRRAAYEKLFAGLSRDEQTAILRQASEDVEGRGATVPDYMGNYYDEQFRDIEIDAFCDVLEREYGSKIDRHGTYVDTILRSVEGSLQRLKTDYVDILMCPHGATSSFQTQIPEVYEAFETLKKQGKVRFLGVSAHSDPAGVLQGAMASGVYSLAMIAYNFVNRRRVEPAIEEAHRRDFGVIAMKVALAAFKTGREKGPAPERVALLNQLVPGDLNTHQRAYKFSLSNPHLSAVVSNLSNEQMVKENVQLARG